MLLVFILPAAILFSSFQDVSTQDENTIKALFVYNFTKHIEWPAPKLTTNKFEILVMGNSALTARLTTILKDRKILDKPVEVREVNNIDDALNCQILFIANGQGSKLNPMLDKCNGKSVLVITEEKKMNSHGACINIYAKNNHLRFELNDAVIKHEGFKVSNQLYELATVSR